MAGEQDRGDAGGRFAAEELQQQTGTPARLGLLAEQFSALAQSLLRADTVHEVLLDVVATARAVIPGAEMVSVTLCIPGGGFSTPVQTDPVARELDELQYQFDEGPCVDATRTPGSGLGSCDDLGLGEDYPDFGPAAASRGVHCVLAAGLFARGGAGPRGALNLYSYTPHALDDADRDVLNVLAAHASVALAHTDAVTAADLHAAQLREALSSRDVIGQAKGILMERRGISAEQAFDILRRSSQDLNVKLATLAKTIAARRDEL